VSTFHLRSSYQALILKVGILQQIVSIYIFGRRRGPPNVVGPGVANSPYPTLSTGLECYTSYWFSLWCPLWQVDKVCMGLFAILAYVCVIVCIPCIAIWATCEVQCKTSSTGWWMIAFELQSLMAHFLSRYRCCLCAAITAVLDCNFCLKLHPQCMYYWYQQYIV